MSETTVTARQAATYRAEEAVFNLPAGWCNDDECQKFEPVRVHADLASEIAKVAVEAALASLIPADLFIAARRGYEGLYIYRLTDTGRIEVASNRTTGAHLWHILAELIPASQHDCPSCEMPLAPQDDSDLGWQCRSCKTYGVPESLS